MRPFRAPALAMTALGWIVACASEYGEAGSVADADAGADGSTFSDAGPVDDAPSRADVASEASTGWRGTCPPPAHPSTSGIEMRQPVVIYKPKEGPAFPFDIVADGNSVFWLENRAAAGLDDPYNAIGASRVMRVVPGNDASVLVVDQPRAAHLAMDDAWLYWLVEIDGGAAEPRTAVLRRTSRSCVGPCVVDEVARFPKGESFDVLAVGAPQVLFVAGGVGVNYRVEARGALPVIPTNLGTTAAFPGIGITPSSALLTARETSAIVSVTLDGKSKPIPLASVPPRDGGSPGVYRAVTDCESLWGFRARETIRFALDGGAVLGARDIPVANMYTSAVDQRFVYVGGVDGQGLYAIDRASPQLLPIALAKTASVWGVATDDKGVYWGEHTRDVPDTGVIYMLPKQAK